MDFRHRKSPPSDRFLGVSHPTAAASSAGDELDEDDVFWTGDFSESSHQSNGNGYNSAAASTPPNPIHFRRPAAFGILAALPEDEAPPRRNPLFHHRSSSSRMIPIVPKSPQERISLPSSVPYNQSAPVNVPAMSRSARREREFDEVDNDGDDGEEGEMLPPHEMVARSSAHSPILACSVLEGVGRTLKGRDLRQVRNAVLRRTACQQVVKGKVSCLDCPKHYDLAGVQVLVKCDKVKKLSMATTEEDGVFEVELPLDSTPKAPTQKCHAKLFGGPNKMYASSKNMVSRVVKAQDSMFYTVSTPLAFSTTCASCKDRNRFGSKKTIDLPIPAEWGLAPTSYYVPFFPIIGIP